jgi:hypothetical protein
VILLLALTLGCSPDPASAEDTDVADTNEPADTDDTEEPGPTTGPGVLGDETGLEAMCRRFFECGGTWYDDEEDCIQSSYDYWGECTAAKDALDALGACVAEVECSEYDPDSYHPDSVGCDEEWDDLNAADC